MPTGGEDRVVSRRRLLPHSAVLTIASVGLPLLGACTAPTPAAPTSLPEAAPKATSTAPAAAPASVTAQPKAVALGKLPTFMPVQGPPPDLPGSGDGLVSPGWAKYPKLFQAVKEPPGAGAEVTVSLETIGGGAQDIIAGRRSIGEWDQLVTDCRPTAATRSSKRSLRRTPC
jgi:hypothetical protein